MAGEETVQLRDVCVKIGSGATPRGGKEAYKGGATSLIRSQNIYNEGFHRDGLVYIDDDQSAELRNVEVKPNDVLLNITGDSVARCCQVAEDVLPARVNQHVAIIRPQPKSLDARFLRYVLVSHEYQSRLLALASAGATRPALTKSMIEELDIPSPPLAEQKAIAAVLGALDDKIELNRRMNATLEAMARALFQSWFVDFDPVRAKLDGRPPAALDPATAALFPASFQDSTLGHIPKGWEAGSILRQADLLSGGTPKTDVPAYWNGDVPWASAKDVSQCGEAFLVSTERTITKQGVEESSTKIIPANATVVVARGATTGRLTMFGHAMAMNQTCYGLRSKVGTPFALYCNARHFIERLVQGGHGSIFDTITTSTFEATDVLLAPKEVLLAFDKQVTPLFQQVHANLHQSRTLATLRDTLLPKLLSGEWSVASLELLK
jgi:type I restriction enzyme S subunit